MITLSLSNCCPNYNIVARRCETCAVASNGLLNSVKRKIINHIIHALDRNTLCFASGFHSISATSSIARSGSTTGQSVPKRTLSVRKNSCTAVWPPASVSGRRHRGRYGRWSVSGDGNHLFVPRVPIWIPTSLRSGKSMAIRSETDGSPDVGNRRCGL